MVRPLVSVILPVFNGEEFLQDCLDSVWEQEYDHYELIVIDDGSTDGSGAIAGRDDRIRYYYQVNQGVAAARNLGINKSRGEYIAFIDADDLWHREKLLVQIEYMVQNPSIGYTFTKHRLFLHKGLEQYPDWVRKNHSENELTAYIPSSLAVKKSVFDQVGLFDTSYTLAEDSDWFLRARDSRIPMAVIDEMLLFKRVHDRNLSRQTDLTQQFLFKALKTSIMRRKNKEGRWSEGRAE